jgi:hypothetical protein
VGIQAGYIECRVIDQYPEDRDEAGLLYGGALEPPNVAVIPGRYLLNSDDARTSELTRYQR